MAKLLLGDQSFEVEPLADVPTDWPGIKVMSTGAKLEVPVGAVVKVESEDGNLAGSYKVVYRLAPAYPRTWRLLLERDGAAPAAEVAPASESGPAHVSTSESLLANGDKTFTIKVSGVVGGGVRKSVLEYKVPFSRLSQEVKRITKMGGQILSISESNVLSNLN
ncbi:CpcD phycobilisome linker protein [Synechococcus sp. Nb3U1]|uniref:phycobilisome linker polypeptide n=1 Tax=Synechococcus sp. Nb3U1 TaxID=1914529 RepID=UPI001F4004E9|nr:phycobilisome linker polypeptide [Synechococcus sp. Nb3U1]MCF2969890.1 CpcD phycobilisome linker protein [Synechococcus sp. Nb3U1]